MRNHIELFEVQEDWHMVIDTLVARIRKHGFEAVKDKWFSEGGVRTENATRRFLNDMIECVNSDVKPNQKQMNYVRLLLDEIAKAEPVTD